MVIQGPFSGQNEALWACDPGSPPPTPSKKTPENVPSHSKVSKKVTFGGVSLKVTQKLGFSMKKTNPPPLSWRLGLRLPTPRAEKNKKYPKRPPTDSRVTFFGVKKSLPGRGGTGRVVWSELGNLGGGGAKYFFRGRNVHQGHF